MSEHPQSSQGPTQGATDIFSETVRGRVPQAHAISSAETWMPKDTTVPRPDKSIGWLRLLTFVGLDHMYLRSPITGMFKLLGLGVLIGILVGAPGGFKGLAGIAAPAALWYLWDIAQIWLEKDRVVNYGMSLPFDVGQRIGQGVINPDFTGRDQTSHYEQRKEFSVYAVRVLLSFLGVDALMGKPALFMRKISEFIMFMGILSGIWYNPYWTSSTFWSTFWSLCGLMILLFLAPLYAIFVCVPWWAGVSAVVLNPERMMTQGIQFDPDTLNILNYFTSWMKDVSPEAAAGVVYDYGYSNSDPSQLRNDFQIMYRNNAAHEEDAQKKKKKKDAGKDGLSTAPIPTASYIFSFWLGNPVTGYVFSWILPFLTPGPKAAVKSAITFVMAKAACERQKIAQAAGAPPELAGCEGMALLYAGKAGASGFAALVPGAGNLIKQGMDVAGQVQGVVSQVQGVADQVTEGVARVQGVVSQVQGVVEKGKAAKEQFQGLAGQVSGQVAGQVASHVQGVVEETTVAVKNQVQGFAGQVAGQVRDVVEGTKDSVKNQVQGLAAAVTAVKPHELIGSATSAIKVIPPHPMSRENTVQAPVQVGGGNSNSNNSLSTESKLLGVVTMALIVGGAAKAAIDSLVRE